MTNYKDEAKQELKEKNRSHITEAGEWISTTYVISQTIPGCEILQDISMNWVDWDDDRRIPEIKAKIQQVVNGVFDQVEAYEIAGMVYPLRVNEKYRNTVIPKLRPLLRKRYQALLDSDNKILPQPFGIILPFFINRKGENSEKLEIPIIKQAGKTTLIIERSILKSEDGKLFLALGRIMRSKVSRVTREGLYFKTDETEINSFMGRSQPSVPRPSIRKGLERLRSSNLIIKRDGLIIITGLVTKVRIDKRKKRDDIEIMMDRDFLEALDTHGYIDIDPNVSNTLSPSVNNLYLWLRNQVEFKNFGRITKIGNKKFYDRLGFDLKGKADYTIRDHLRKLLQTAKNKYVIKDFWVGKEFTCIGSIEFVKGNKKIDSKYRIERIKNPNKSRKEL